MSTWSDDTKKYCCQHAKKGCPPKTCTLWGDPHVITFDQVGDDKNQAVSFYGDGDFWVVRSSQVSIQGRFEGTKYTERLAATNQIVVSGAFIHGHKIEVGTQDSGIVTVDGASMSFGTTSHAADNSFSVSYDSNGQVPDVVPEGNEKRVVHMTLPLGIKVDVFQWTNYLDVQITMSSLPDQDGVCGNFNGDHGDDSTRNIFERIGARVKPGENLLSGQAKIEWTHQMQAMLHAECASTTLAAAKTHCTTFLGSMASTPNLPQACQFDYCFGINVLARKHAKTYA
jgi:hypothetical protein